MISKGKQKIIRSIETFILKYKVKAKRHRYDANDDIKCFKRIYVIATVFPVNEKYYRNIPEIEAVDSLINLIKEHGDWVDA